MQYSFSQNSKNKGEDQNLLLFCESSTQVPTENFFTVPLKIPILPLLTILLFIQNVGIFKLYSLVPDNKYIYEKLAKY